MRSEEEKGRPPVACLSIVGRKGAGRSDLMTFLIHWMSQKGYRIGALKPILRDDVEIDVPGSDSFHYRMEGAQKVVLAGKKRLAVFSNLEDPVPLEDLLGLFSDFDLVLIEGDVSHEVAKIESYRTSCGLEPKARTLRHVLAIYSDEPVSCPQPNFLLPDVSLLADFIEKKFLEGELCFGKTKEFQPQA